MCGGGCPADLLAEALRLRVQHECDLRLRLPEARAQVRARAVAAQRHRGAARGPSAVERGAEGRTCVFIEDPLLTQMQ